MKIHQILSGFADGDAMSREAILMREIFRGWGASSDIFAEPDAISPTLRSDALPLSDYESAPDDACVHHYGIASEATEVFLSSRARKILYYHNITPAEFFDGFDDGLAAGLRRARAGLANVASKADSLWAVSGYNADELRHLGFTDVKVFPLLFGPDILDLPPDPLVAGKMTNDLKNILFVGRVVPNKRIEDLILAFAWYHKRINPYSRLVIVGSNQSAPRYFTMLQMIAGELDLPNVCFEGFTSAAGLVACYKAADVYVCPSAHEGYCLPLLEAMHMGVPVIARDAGGVSEALEGAGVLYDGLNAVELAELVGRVLSDCELREDILLSQGKRMKRVRERDPDSELRKLMSE